MTIIFPEMPEAYEPKATTITYGYDRHVKSWCIIVEDQEKCEIESSYVYSKDECMHEIEYFKEKYGITATKKYKAY